jgi:O-antigen ligase
MWSLGSSIVGGIAFIWGAPWRQGEALRVFRTLQRAALGIALAVVMMFFVYPDAFQNRLAIYSETLDPRSPTSELVHRSRDYPLKNFLAAFDYDRWPYGYGIGTISLGGQYVSRIFHVRPPVGGVESGFGALIVEMGILGLILWIAVGLAIVFSAWKVVRGLKGSPWFPLAFMILLYAFVLLLPMTFVSMNNYQDFILNAYLWLLLGILFRLPSLALSAQSSADIAAVPTARRWVR